MRTLISLFTIAGSFASLSATAATLCVNPAGSGACESSIQDAVDLADPGDIIKIAPGTYREFVVVTGLDGLILQGGSARTTVIDPNFAPGEEGLDIAANNVQVIGIGINNSTTAGIRVAGNGFIMQKSQVQNADDNCVVITSGSAAVFDGNRFFGCDSNAVEVVTGNSVTFTNNRMTNTGSNGLFVDDGDDLFAEKNICENVGSDCIHVDGDDAEISKNSSYPANGHTVNVDGDRPLIEGNRAVGSGGVATVDNSDSPVVLKNIAIDSDSDGVAVTCDNTTCTGALIQGNRISVTQDNGDCLDLAFNFAGAIVMKNTGLKCDDAGIEISGNGAATVEGNTMSKVGSAAGDGFNVAGAGVKTLIKNKISQAGGDGFDVDDAAHVLEDNQSKNNAQNGFLVREDADGTQMTGNQATGNGEEGIENRATGLVLTDNKASGNSLDWDFCNSVDAVATFAEGVVGSNDFGSTTPPNQKAVCLNE